MRCKQRSSAHALMLMMMSVTAAPALAGFTTVENGTPNHITLLNQFYGGTFVGTGAPLPNGYSTVFSNGVTTVTRVDDDGVATLLNMFTGSPGTGDDDSWTDGIATATAHARFAVFTQEFGYDTGMGFVKLFDVTGGGFSATGSGMITFGSGSVWSWARANDSDASLHNPHYSEETLNNDGLDHLVTYRVVGAPGVPANRKVWLLFWEDLNGPLGDSSNPLNQGFAANRDFNDLVVELQVEQCTTVAQCDDQNACTVDFCDLGACVHLPDSCDDKDACTMDMCDPVDGCSNPPLDCDDGVDCTIDACHAKTGCLSEIDPLFCEDDNECTNEVCDPVNGCIVTNQPAGTSCGNPVPGGLCDGPDVCDGNGQCIPNTTPQGQVCRVAAGLCDVQEVCDGSSPQCPPDIFEPGTEECRSSAGTCDIAEFCTGSSAQCPADVLEPNTTACRTASGLCDADEFCTGASVACPPDVFHPVGFECRPAGDSCDVPELCTGSEAACPPDLLAPDTTVCRVAAGECDQAELCTGDSIACPGDDQAANGTPCTDDGDECTSDTCDGNGACLHVDSGLCGACCLANQDCMDGVLAATCGNLGGDHAGAGTLCGGDADLDGVDDLCDRCPGVDDEVFGVLVCSGTGMGCESDDDCPEDSVCLAVCETTMVPAASEWGLVILALLLMVFGKLYFGYFRRHGVGFAAA